MPPVEALLHHWPEYLIEAGLLGAFMISACVFGMLLEHPAWPGYQRVRHPLLRRALMGMAMGLTAVALIHSPWGRRSGAHMNPATTAAFLLLGKVATWDALFYIVAQFLGGVGGVVLASLALREWLKHQSVNYVVTTPGRRGPGVAWIAELLIAFGMMLTVLWTSNHPDFAPFTGIFAGVLLAVYITLEAPLSGMSLNPARTFGSAIVARHWKAMWVYFTAPMLGMLLAAAAYAGLSGPGRVYCAKLNHGHDGRCIFHCEFGQHRAVRDRGVSEVLGGP